MKDKRSNKDGGRPTLGDALSSGVRADLKMLKASLQQRVAQSVARQVARPPEPWRRQPTRPVERKGAPSAQGKAPARQRVQPASPKVVPNAGVASKRIAVETKNNPTAPATPAARPVEQSWELPGNASVREKPPVTVRVESVRAVQAVFAAGIATTGANDGDPLYATIGLDFGTSCSKIVVRFPYEAGSPAIAIPAPEYCRSGGDPYLWQTVVWVRGDGEFLPWPEQGALVLHSLKQGLVAGRPNEIVASLGSGRGATRLEAATAYLAYVIRYVRGWVVSNRPDLVRGRSLSWFVNVGLPAANFDKSDLVVRYRAVCATALMLASGEEPMTVESVRACADQPEVSKAASSIDEGIALGVAVFPEVAAEVAGFLKSTVGSSGLYFLVDVGAMTLDLCMFRFAQATTGADKYPLLEAAVHTLGVEAYHWFREKGRPHEDFVTACRRAIREVIGKTRKDRDSHAPTWRKGNDLPIFLAGGGARGELHQQVVGEVGTWLQGWVHNDGARILAPTIPDHLQFPAPGGDFSRLPVAWGLSLDPTEIGDITPPSAIEDIPRARVRDYTGNFTSKDQM